MFKVQLHGIYNLTVIKMTLSIMFCCTGLIQQLMTYFQHSNPTICPSGVHRTGPNNCEVPKYFLGGILILFLNADLLQVEKYR